MRPPALRPSAQTGQASRRAQAIRPGGAGLQGHFIESLPVLNETVWFHHDTGMLVATDPLFCLSSTTQGLTAFVATLLGVTGTLGMSRTMKLTTRDKRALARAVAPLLLLPVQRVIVAHDQVIHDQPGEQLARAFAWLR